jgi:predicted acetyltransferase
MQVNVQPKDVITTRTINSIEIVETIVQLNTSAKIVVKILDENGGLINVEVLTISENDYTNWGDDDQYIIEYALTQLGLVAQA